MILANDTDIPGLSCCIVNTSTSLSLVKPIQHPISEMEWQSCPVTTWMPQLITLAPAIPETSLSSNTSWPFSFQLCQLLVMPPQFWKAWTKLTPSTPV